MLHEKHPLPIDSDIVYDDYTHTYGLRSRPTVSFSSVTKVASSRFPPFNKSLVSAKLSQSTRGKYAGMTPAEIEKSWATTAKLGTQLHAEIETYYNGGALPAHQGFRKAAAMLQDVLGLRPWRTELKMASSSAKIAGTADMIFHQAFKTPAEGVIIVDWKRMEDAPDSCKYDNCSKELAHLQAGKFWKYALQLNLYAQLLWDSCKIPTVQMLLVLLHPDGTGYDVLRVPRMPEAAVIYRNP